MGPTTWDGHVRVDYLPESRRLQVTLITVEPTREAQLRRGLRAGFVIDDPDGPPAFVAADLPAAFLPADLGELLGPRLAPEARLVIGEEPQVRWSRLGLSEVDDLAETWAPYRAVVLAGVEQPSRMRAVGAWAGGLWARLGVEDIVAGIAALGPPTPAMGDVRYDHDDPFGGEPEEPEVLGSWELPASLAQAAGVEARLQWSAAGGLVTVTARRVAAPGAPLAVMFDDGRGRWTVLEPDGEGVLRAAIASSADPAVLPAVRVRVGEQP